MKSIDSLGDRIAERDSSTRLLKRWTYRLIAAGAGLVAVLAFAAAGTFAGHQQAAAADQSPSGGSDQASGQLQSPDQGFFGSGGAGRGGGVVTGGS
jgi:hypothetical protein